MCNWLLPCFPNNYARERNSDVREYYAGLRREWKFCINKSNALHNDVIFLRAPLVNRTSLTKPRRNVDEWRRVVYWICKENNLMLLRRSKYYMLQLVEELAIATNRQLTPREQNNILNYESYLSEWMSRSYLSEWRSCWRVIMSISFLHHLC